MEEPNFIPVRFDQSYVYVLRDPKSKAIHYVGVTDRLQVRYAHHMRPVASRERSRRAAWLRSLAALGRKPEMCIVETVTNENRIEAEDRWIKFFEERGEPLTNSLRRRPPLMVKKREGDSLLALPAVPPLKWIAFLVRHVHFAYAQGRADEVRICLSLQHREDLDALCGHIGGKVNGPYSSSGRDSLVWRMRGEALGELAALLEHYMQRGPKFEQFQTWRATRGDWGSRMVCGERHYCARLTAEEVRRIRARGKPPGMTWRQLAAEHRISSGSIQAILRGQTWKSVA